jgi:uncharacterized phage protein (TIGR02218 family)
MKPHSPELLALLATRQFFVADLWTITLVGGVILRYCAGDAPITANGLLYPSGGVTGPYFDRTDNKAKCHWGVGTSADTLIVDVIPGGATVLGQSFLAAVRAGVFDGAEVMLERAFMPTYGDTRVGVVRQFVGRQAELVAGRSIATMSINSHLELLNRQFPRNVVQVGCLNNLGDTQCTVSLGSFQRTATLTGTPGIGSFTATLGASVTSGFLDLGTVTFTSGALNGFTATVKSAPVTGGTTATVSLVGQLPSPPSAGDTCTITYGCNKSYTDANGCPKFSNTVHYRGMPFVPQPTVAV